MTPAGRFTGAVRGRPARLAGALVCAAMIAACAGSAGSSSPASGSAGARSATTSTRGRATKPGVISRAQAAAVPDADWPTFDFDAQRTGVGPSATGITPANLHSLGLRVVHLDGTVDSAPIALAHVTIRGRSRDAVFMTTTYGRTIAIDPGTGGHLWEYTPSDIGRYQGTFQVATATPVADPGRRYLYAASPDGFIHKLSVATGAEVRSGGWPVRVTYNASREKLASALNLSGNSLIVVTGGYIGDIPVYQGHLVIIDRSSGQITHVFNALCSEHHGLINPTSACHYSDAAFWARQGAVVRAGSGQLLVTTGNAYFNGHTNWGDSVLQLSPAAVLLHSWTPTDQETLRAHDTDLGSTSPAPVTVGGRHLAVQGGKDRKLHLLDLDRLNGTTGPAGPRLGGELAEVPSPGSAEVATAPVVWSHAGRQYVIVAEDGGTAAYVVQGGSHPGLSRAWGDSTPGTSPVLAGGLLYVFDEVDGALMVEDPATGARLATLHTRTGHWNSPIVVGGRIVLPVGSYHTHSTSGELEIWHLSGR